MVNGITALLNLAAAAKNKVPLKDCIPSVFSALRTHGRNVSVAQNGLSLVISLAMRKVNANAMATEENLGTITGLLATHGSNAQVAEIGFEALKSLIDSEGAFASTKIIELRSSLIPRILSTMEANETSASVVEVGLGLLKHLFLWISADSETDDDSEDDSEDDSLDSASSISELSNDYSGSEADSEDAASNGFDDSESEPEKLYYFTGCRATKAEGKQAVPVLLSALKNFPDSRAVVFEAVYILSLLACQDVTTTVVSEEARVLPLVINAMATHSSKRDLVKYSLRVVDTILGDLDSIVLKPSAVREHVLQHLEVILAQADRHSGSLPEGTSENDDDVKIATHSVSIVEHLCRVPSFKREMLPRAVIPYLAKVLSVRVRDADLALQALTCIHSLSDEDSVQKYLVQDTILLPTLMAILYDDNECSCPMAHEALCIMCNMSEQDACKELLMTTTRGVGKTTTLPVEISYRLERNRRTQPATLQASLFVMYQLADVGASKTDPIGLKRQARLLQYLPSVTGLLLVDGVDATTLQSALGVIGRLAESEENKAQQGLWESIPSIMKVIAVHPVDSTIARNGLFALLNLARGSSLALSLHPELKASALKSLLAALPGVIAALHTHSSSADVVENGLSVIQELVSLQPAIKADMIAQIFSVAQAALHANTGNSELVAAALGAIASTATSSNYKDYHGGVSVAPAIVAALKTQLGNASHPLMVPLLESGLKSLLKLPPPETKEERSELIVLVGTAIGRFNTDSVSSLGGQVLQRTVAAGT